MQNNFQYQEIDKEGHETLSVIAEAIQFNEWMFQTISKYCHGKTLEVGSGIGNISEFFIKEKREIVLSDIRSNYCDFLAQKFETQVLFRNLDLIDPFLSEKYENHFNTFDTVFALNVVEHIKDDTLAIANSARFLKRGGALVILVPAYQFLYNTFDKELGHYKRYATESMSAIFTSAGLKIKHTQYFNAAGIPGWWISGKLQQNKTIPSGQMKLYNTLVPLFKIADKILFNKIGLSAIVVGEKL